MTLQQIDQLIAFKTRDKFSDEAWESRGLNPSPKEVSLQLTKLFNSCADALIQKAKNEPSEKELKNTLHTCLSNFDKMDYDTEESEFVCDLFFELSQILNIEFGENLEAWLYGAELAAAVKAHREQNPSKVVETIRHNCPGCGTSLDTYIMKKEKGIPDFSWTIIQCNNCNEYTIISYGPEAKEVNFGNYGMIEHLEKSKFTREQAEIRLNEVRQLKRKTR